MGPKLPPTLCVRPPSRHFGPDEAADLAAALADGARFTLLEEIGSAADLQIGPDGRTASGDRYTASGLRQAANLACPGLHAMVVDLAGPASEGADPGERSFELARRAFNRVVEVRINRFVGASRLIRDVRRKTIDGLIGARYSPLGNDAVHERALEVAASRDRPMAFLEATLAGRLLLVRFLEPEPLVDLGEGPSGRYRVGLHFANSEVSGESTVRAAVLLRRELCGGSSMGRFLGGRRVHSGRDFNQKVAVVFGEAADVRVDPAKLKARFRALAAAGLGLGFDLEEDREARVDAIASQLRDLGVPKGVAAAAVRDAAAYGQETPRAGDFGMPRLLPKAVLEGRSQRDLYTSLTAAARSLYATSREAVEQAAHRLLMDKIKIR